MRVLVTVFAFLSIVSTAYAWGDDPVPSRAYTRQDILALATEGRAVIQDRSGFFIDSGHIFYFNGSDAPVYVERSKNEKSLISFQGKLASLGEDGAVYLMIDHLSPGKGKWQHIGSSVSKFATDGTNLYLLTKREKLFGGTERGILVYKGLSDTKAWSVVVTASTVGGGIVPYSTGKVKDIEERDIPDAVDLVSSEGGTVVALTESGGRILLSREGSNPSHEQSLEQRTGLTAQ